MVPNYTDDNSIGNDEILYRRVKLNVDLVTFDPSSRRLRPTSTAFKNTVKLNYPEGESPGTEPERIETYMSVFVHTRLTELSLLPDRVLEGVDSFVLVRLTVQEVRETGVQKGAIQQTFHAPEPPPPPCMQAHGGVAGNKTKGLRNAFSELAVWIVKPSLDWVLANRSTLRIPDNLSIDESNYDSLFA